MPGSSICQAAVGERLVRHVGSWARVAAAGNTRERAKECFYGEHMAAPASHPPCGATRARGDKQQGQKQSRQSWLAQDPPGCASLLHQPCICTQQAPWKMPLGPCLVSDTPSTGRQMLSFQSTEELLTA